MNQFQIFIFNLNFQFISFFLYILMQYQNFLEYIKNYYNILV